MQVVSISQSEKRRVRATVIVTQEEHKEILEDFHAMKRKDYSIGSKEGGFFIEFSGLIVEMGIQDVYIDERILIEVEYFIEE